MNFAIQKNRYYSILFFMKIIGEIGVTRVELAIGKKLHLRLSRDAPRWLCQKITKKDRKEYR